MDAVLVCSDDWEGLFFDGVLATEGHHISLGTVFEKLIKNGNKVDSFTVRYCSVEWIEEEGNFPPNLSDVVFAK